MPSGLLAVSTRRSTGASHSTTRNAIHLMGSDEVFVIDNDQLRQIGKARLDAE